MPNSYTCLHYHLIFSTKNRSQQITPARRDRLYSYMGGIIKDEKGILLCAGGMPDHVHLLVTMHPSRAVSDMLRAIKSGSSKWVHHSFPERADFGWQDGYGAFTVSSSNLEQVKMYIARQEEHHRRLTFQEEFITLLKRHGVT